MAMGAVMSCDIVRVRNRILFMHALFARNVPREKPPIQRRFSMTNE